MWMDSMNPTDVEIYLPKFTYKTEYQPLDPLEKNE